MFRDYHKAGFRVFGLYGLNKGLCECGNKDCEAYYKHPRVSNWQHTPNWSQDQVACMEMTGQFSTGFGVLCSGYLIIDIDPRNGGNEAYDQLVKDTGIDYKKDSSFVVATGGGGWHIYYKHEGAERLHSNLKAYKGIDFKSSGFVVGASSMHESGNIYEVEEGFPDEVGKLPTVLFDLLAKKIEIKKEFSANSGVVTEQEIQQYLEYVTNSDLEYDEWLEIGMIIHESLGEEGFQVWDSWSRKSEKYQPDLMENKYHSFGKNPSRVTIGTLIQRAKQNGYIEPVTFETTLTYDVDPLFTDDIDTKKAPGLVGECINYINSCSRYPREHLAVAAGLMSVANIGGMRFEDESYGVTPNFFAFNVAGSATGKEAVQQAQSELLICAGLGKANYGVIKSEQEIYRNVYKHQLVSYVIDEFGILLNKIESASKGGAASYLGGIIGALMSVYSKADGNLPLGADFGEAITTELNKEIAAITKLIDNNEAKPFHHEKLESLQALGLQLNAGYISKPFLTLSGYTTPSTFNNIVSFAQATNGFIGRAILFEEKNNNPPAKKRFKKPKLSDQLKNKLIALNTGGSASAYNAPRIEFNGTRTPITTNDDAMGLLEAIQDTLHDMAEHAMETNGLEAIVRRAFELVLKVSMILAMGDGGVRTVAHVKWAYALIKKDIENKINLTGANMAADEKNLSEEVLSKVKHRLDLKNGASVGVISNKLRGIDKENIQKALDFLVNNNEAIQEEVQPKRGPKVMRYYAKA